jgi:hypothetical protein
MSTCYKVIAAMMIVLTLFVGCGPVEPAAPTMVATASPTAVATATLVAPTAAAPLSTVQPVTQPPPMQDLPETSPAIAPIVASLAGLSLDDFFEVSWKQLRLRDPASITYDGLAEEYGVRNDQLNNLSDDFIRETQELEIAILHLLRTYDRESLTPEQQISFDVYEWYLDNRVRGHEFMYHNLTPAI